MKHCIWKGSEFWACTMQNNFKLLEHFSFFFFLTHISFWKQIKKHSIIVGKLMNDLKIEPYVKQKEENN